MTSTDIADMVMASLTEDVAAGDITAELVGADVQATARLTVRESAVICGIDWFNTVYQQLDHPVTIDWLVADGDRVEPNQLIATLTGQARTLLTGERCALNWLQTLSATATRTAGFVAMVSGTAAQILDTRKTIPGLRLAQKYAVKTGGGLNHRFGLYDAFLIKENHIMSSASIADVIQRARALYPDRSVEIEVEDLAQLQQALAASADIIMCDNFSIKSLKAAVELTQGQAKLEASGNVDETTLKQIAATGVDYISIGGLTKHIEAIDLSMRFTMERA